MKKMLLIVLLIVCVLCTACTQVPAEENTELSTTLATSAPTETTTVSQLEETTVPVSETETSAPTETSPPEVHIDRALLTIGDYDEYESFVAKMEKGSEFVAYERIQSLGDFKSFVCLSNGYSGDYSKYMYNLSDASGYDFVLYVTHNAVVKSYGPEADKPLSATGEQNLRNRADATGGVLDLNNVQYRYSKYGKIMSISWIESGVEFTISAQLDEYPNVTDTVLGKLLTYDTAVAAKQSLMEDVKLVIE